MSRKSKARKEAQLDRLRKKAIAEADVLGMAKPSLPQAFENAVYQAYGSLVNLRGKDPQQLLPGGQLLVKLDSYAIIPLEQYQQMLMLLNKSQHVVNALKKEHIAKGKKLGEEIKAAPIVKAPKAEIAQEPIEMPVEVPAEKQTNFSF